MNNWNRGFIAWGVALVATLAFSSAATAAPAVSLAGEWRFEIAGTNSEAYARQLPGKIRLPGTMDDADLGPSPSLRVISGVPRK
jgi:hypothetical protein